MRRIRIIGGFLIGIILGGIGLMGQDYWIGQYGITKRSAFKGERVSIVILTGILSATLGGQVLPYSILFINLIMISLLITLAYMDFQYMLLPTVMIRIGVVSSLILRWLLYRETQEIFCLIDGIVGALVGFFLFYLVFYGSLILLSRQGLGFGDVRLMAFLGMLVGLEGIFILIVIASLVALLGGGIQYLVKKKSEPFPFGPYLCGSGVMMLLYGRNLITIYLQWLLY